MVFGIISQLILQLVLPAYFVYRLWKTDDLTTLSRHLVALYSILGTLYLVATARWDITSVYLSYIWVSVVLFAVIRAYRRKPGKKSTKKLTSANLTDGLFAVLAIIGAISAISGWVTPSHTVSLASPLAGNNNYVAHGGGSTFINYHHANEAQAYALDIGQVNTLGHQTVLSSNPEDYAIFGKDLMSPCNGWVTAVKSDLHDLRPPEVDKNKDNRAGNHVVLVCPDQKIKVLLAHMKHDSIIVKQGEAVGVGQKLGQVGNTGNTTQPHLHMHAVHQDEDIMKGRGVPLRINEKYLTRNSVF